MSQRSSRIARTVTLSVVMALGAALMMAMNTVAEPTTDNGLGEQAASPAICDDRLDVEPGQTEALLEPTAICRLMPECAVDSDCDYLCGEDLGKCGHSRCPVRVCRCR